MRYVPPSVPIRQRDIRGPQVPVHFKVIDPYRLGPGERGRQRAEWNRVARRDIRARQVQQPYFWYIPGDWVQLSNSKLKPSNTPPASPTPEAKHG